MVKVLVGIIVFLGCIGASFAQSSGGEATPVQSKTGKKLKFSEIKIEGNEAEASYKKLVIWFKTLPDASQSTYTEEGKTYRSFATEQEAHEAYIEEKQSCPDKVIYVVHSETKKPPKVITFRIEH